VVSWLWRTIRQEWEYVLHDSNNMNQMAMGWGLGACG